MRVLVFLLAFTLSGFAAGQQGKGGKQQMRQEDRQRMREDMRQVYKDKSGRPDRQRPMTPEEREKLRRDIQDANRNLKR